MSIAMFVGLNPSAADETCDDPTDTRCQNYARDWGYGLEHSGRRLLSQFVATILVMLSCSSAEASFFNDLIGGSDYEVGQVLNVEIKKFKEPQLVKSTFDLYWPNELFAPQDIKITDANWDDQKHKMTVQGFPADRINWRDYRSSIGFTVKVAELLSKDAYPSTRTIYYVTATFDKFNSDTEREVAELEKKTRAIQAKKDAEKDAEAEAKRIAVEKCRIDFDALTEEGGSLSKLEVLATTRCKNDLDDKEVRAKWEKILVLRQKQLLAGAQKIQDFRDATLLHQPEVLESIMSSPLLMPNKKMYGNNSLAITIDAQEQNNLLRGKIIFGESSYGEVNFKYVYLRTNAKTTVFHPDKLRIGASISVIGRYVSNATYTTLGGAEKMAPVLDVMFIE